MQEVELVKELMNLAVEGTLFEEGFGGDFKQVQKFTEAIGLEGVEMILYGDYDLSQVPEGIIQGNHLLYWPNWLDFWYGKKERLIESFFNEENILAYYGTMTPAGMVAYYKRAFEEAKAMKAKYMVFHVANVSFEGLFTEEYRYTNEEVMAAATELINQVFVGDGPMLLFENLWLPGLTYESPLLTEKFLEGIQYEHKGYLLDVSHLMATSLTTDSAEQGIAYIHKILDGLGHQVKDIKGVHLNYTLSGPYRRQDRQPLIQKFMDRKDIVEGFQLIMEHIGHIDSHGPMVHKGIQSIIDRIQPAYLVHELKADSVQSLEKAIIQQKEALGTII